MLWSIAIISMTGFFTKKAVDLFYPDKINQLVKKVSYNYGWSILEYTSKVEMFVTKKWHKYKNYFFTFNNKQEIIFIKDGVKKHRFNLNISLLKELGSNNFNIKYDSIIQNVPIKEVDEYDTYSNCCIVYENHKDVICRSFIKPPKCIEFKTMILSFKNNDEKMYKIDLKHNQFHIPGNALYDRKFFRWIIKEEYGVDIKDEQYTVTFLDHNMNYITLLDTCYILIEEEDYKLINIDNDKSM